MTRRKQLEACYRGTSGELFEALGRTLAFRRWPIAATGEADGMPQRGFRYRQRFGSVLRAGRVVEVIVPVAVTLKEVLADPPCRVGLKLRWRIEPGYAGCTVRLSVQYRLNHAAWLRRRHWDRRLELHFNNQLRHLARHLDTLQRTSGTPGV